MSLRKKALKGFYWTFLEKFSNKIIGFGVSIILARLLLPQEFGLIGVIYIFTGIGTVLINSGLANSLIKTRDLDNEDFSTVFYFNVIVSVGVYLVLFFSAPYIAQYYEKPILESIVRLYCLVFVFDAFTIIQKTILSIDLNFKKQMLVTLPALIISSIVSVTMAYFDYGVWSLVAGALVYSFFVAVQYWFYSKWRPILKFNKQRFKIHFKFGYKLTLAGLINILFNNVYYVVIGKLFSIHQVGYYQRADSLKEMPVTSLSLVLDKVTYPLFSKIQDDLHLKNAYRQVMKLVIFIIAPTMMILIVVSKTLFLTLYGDNWLPAAPYFQIIAVGSILYPIQVYNVNILKVKGRTDLVFKIVFFTRVLSIVLLLFSYHFGIYALLWTQLITAILFFIIYSHFSGKLINYSTVGQIKDLLPSLFLTLFVGVGLYYFYNSILFLNNFLIVLSVVLVGFISYLVLASIFKMEQIDMIKKIVFSNGKN